MLVAIITLTLASDAIFMGALYAGDIPSGIQAADRVFKIIKHKPYIDVTSELGSTQNM